MITTNNKKEQEIERKDDSLEAATSKMIEKRDRVKSFKDFGFKRASQNLGECFSLKNHLSWIKDGHIVDESFNQNEADLLKKQAENNIFSKNQEKDKLEGERKAAFEVVKPSIEQKIKELNDEIRQIKIDQVNKTIQTGYEPIKFILYSFLVSTLSIYLILFYASTIYAAFFRNASGLIATAGNDITLYLDSIFDVKGIFSASPILLIVYLGAFLFFAIGLIPHNIEGKNKKITILISTSIAFIADAMLAYKIDSGIHNLKALAGIADNNWFFLKSINFYLVLLFGFCAYLVWGFMFNLMLKEKAKKSHDNIANLLIQGIKEQIDSLKIELKEIDIKIIELDTQLKSLESKLAQLQRDIEKRMQNPDVLSQNLTSFYLGWSQWLNSTSEFEEEKNKCEQVFNEFNNTHFTIVDNQVLINN